MINKNPQCGEEWIDQSCSRNTHTHTPTHTRTHACDLAHTHTHTRTHAGLWQGESAGLKALSCCRHFFVHKRSFSSQIIIPARIREGSAPSCIRSCMSSKEGFVTVKLQTAELHSHTDSSSSTFSAAAHSCTVLGHSRAGSQRVRFWFCYCSFCHCCCCCCCCYVVAGAHVTDTRKYKRKPLAVTLSHVVTRVCEWMSGWDKKKQKKKQANKIIQKQKATQTTRRTFLKNY